ncbi:hypothetical protein BSIN_4148 [Burkholderia singularis]|uniref:DUF4917 domain-containing protein n=1 Tax=Burkholderia singularis TaxID=1503053 RepID=A0A238H6Z1_9BURK|nr:hypothetical protein BSIN_4148 [Burkholderia singularis]
MRAMKNKIYEWADIRDDFKEILIVGNGGSIAVHEGFRYSSLFETAKKHGYISEGVRDVFNHFETNDFEFVLRRLWHAKLVSDALKLESERISEAYELVRGALIKTIAHVHVAYEDAEPHLGAIARFMSGFRTVASLNYDLIVYWAAMVGNDEIAGHQFKDGFVEHDGTAFTSNWRRLQVPRGGRNTTMFFYPHGNLVLSRRSRDEERKIRARAGNDLLNSVLTAWETGQGMPLFVCEGVSEHKMRAISASVYLQQVFREVLYQPEAVVAIYGWSMNKQEEHIIRQLDACKPARVAVSVRNGNQQYIQHAYEIFSKMGVADIRFFDSASAGAWNVPEQS